VTTDGSDFATADTEAYQTHTCLPFAPVSSSIIAKVLPATIFCLTTDCHHNNMQQSVNVITGSACSGLCYAVKCYGKNHWWKIQVFSDYTVPTGKYLPTFRRYYDFSKRHCLPVGTALHLIIFDL
jgi:hypothetical protein